MHPGFVPHSSIAPGLLKLRICVARLPTLRLPQLVNELGVRHTLYRQSGSMLSLLVADRTTKLNPSIL